MKKEIKTELEKVMIVIGYIAVFVVLAIFGILYWKYRKEKLHNPHLRFWDSLKKIKLSRKKKK